MPSYTLAYPGEKKLILKRGVRAPSWRKAKHRRFMELNILMDNQRFVLFPLNGMRNKIVYNTSKRSNMCNVYIFVKMFAGPLYRLLFRHVQTWRLSNKNSISPDVTLWKSPKGSTTSSFNPHHEPHMSNKSLLNGHAPFWIVPP